MYRCLSCLEELRFTAYIPEPYCSDIKCNFYLYATRLIKGTDFYVRIEVDEFANNGFLYLALDHLYVK